LLVAESSQLRGTRIFFNVSTSATGRSKQAFIQNHKIQSNYLIMDTLKNI